MVPTQELGIILSELKFLDIFLAFFSATMLFAYRCQRHSRFWLRSGLMLAAIVVVCRIFAATYQGDLLAEVIYSAVLIAMLIVGLNYCYKNSFWTILFYFGSGFMTWYIADRSIIVIASLARLNDALAQYFVEGTLSHIILYCSTFVVVYLLIYSTIGRRMRKVDGSEIPASNAIMLTLVVCILTPIFYFESEWVAHYNLFYYTLLNIGEIIYYVSMLIIQIVMLGSVKERTEFNMRKSFGWRNRSSISWSKKILMPST